MIDFLTHYGATFANWMGIASIISSVSLIIFFSGVGVFGPVNDASSAIQMVLMIVACITIHFLMRSISPALMVAATTVGVISMASFSILQFLLLIKVVSYLQSLPYVLLSTGTIGAWWIAIGLTALMGGVVPQGFAWLSLLAGLSLILSSVGFMIAGEKSILAGIGFLCGSVAVPWWSFWLARLLSSGELHPSG